MSFSPDDDHQSSWQQVSAEYSRAHAALLDGDIGAAQASVDRVGAELGQLTSPESPASDAHRSRAAQAHAELLALAVTQRDAVAKDLFRLRDGRRALRGYHTGRHGQGRSRSV
jgi:hypothetical protein